MNVANKVRVLESEIISLEKWKPYDLDRYCQGCMYVPHVFTFWF